MNLKYILIVVILAVIVAGGILAYQYWWLPKQEIPPPEEAVPEELKTPEEVPPEEVPADETADWKTYRNEEYGFEIKYPNNWHAYLGTTLADEKVIISNLSREEQSRILGKELLEKIEYLSIDIIKIPLNDWLESERDLAESLGMDFATEEIIVRGIKGYKIVITTPEGKKGFSKVLSRGGYVYHIETPFPEKCRFEGCEIFNKILSTFRFLE